MCDAIIVGARWAGSPTAMLLARKGYRLLLVDKAAFPAIRRQPQDTQREGAGTESVAFSLRKCISPHSYHELVCEFPDPGMLPA